MEVSSSLPFPLTPQDEQQKTEEEEEEEEGKEEEAILGSLTEGESRQETGDMLEDMENGRDTEKEEEEEEEEEEEDEEEGGTGTITTEEDQQVQHVEGSNMNRKLGS